MTRGSFGSGRLENTDSGLLRAYEIAKAREERQRQRSKDTRKKLKIEKIRLRLEKSRELRKTKDLAYKIEQSRLNREQQASKDKQQEEARRQAESNALRKNIEPVTERDADPTATKKQLKNVISLFKQGANLAANRISDANKKRAENAERQRAASERAGQDARETRRQMNQRLLPPAPEGAFERGDRTRINQPGTSRPLPPTPRPFRTGQRIRGSRRLLSPSAVGRKKGGPLVPSMQPDTSANPPTSRTETLGQRAKRDRNLRNQLIRQSGGLPEEIQYSCWREEFLFELGDLRKKSKEKNNEDEKQIDVMRGKNHITISPSVSERFNYSRLDETTNGASIFAKATPPLKKRTTPMSDIYLAKQPGRRTAEKVTELMRKLFLGDRQGFYANYDLSGHASDDNDIPGNRNSGKVNENFNRVIEIEDILSFRKKSQNSRG